MEDAEQVQAVFVDPLEGVQLFEGLHHEPPWTLGLIPHKQHGLRLGVFPRQQAAGLQRRIFLHVRAHGLPVFGSKSQRENHRRNTEAPHVAARMRSGPTDARRAGIPSVTLMERVVSA